MSLKQNLFLAEPADGLARERALDPSRSFIVQAPAGSGKTELLTQRCLRLLAGVEQPEQVLAITFTRKAAAEMRARILKALNSANDSMEPSAAHARTTWRLARAVCARDAELGWNLTQHPARLRIQTIDALTGMLARRMPILSGTGAALEPVDDARPLYHAACEHLMKRLGDGSAASGKLEALIVHVGQQIERLFELLIDLLQRRDQWLPVLLDARDSEELRATVEGALSAVVTRHLGQLCSQLPECQRRQMWELTRYAADNLLADPDFDDARRELLNAALRNANTPGSSSADFPGWRGIAEVFLKKEKIGCFYSKVNKSSGFPVTRKEIKARMEALLAELAQDDELCAHLAAVRTLPGLHYSDSQWRILECLFAVLPLAVAELQLVFQQQGRADHVEGSLRALRALGSADEPTDLALAFDYRFRHILVDEFQDTSFTQHELLSRLTAGWTQGDGRTLFCVGDPMQSIYRFRQADVGLFLTLQHRGLEHLPLDSLRLSANFRSARPVVEWVNRVFPRIFPLHDDTEQGAVRYSPSEAARAEVDGGIHVHPGIEASPQTTADTVVQIVRNALARDVHGRIAILVSGRAHLGLIGAQLDREGIEYQAVEIEPLGERPVVQDLIALTRALVHLADRIAWLAVLRAPWCGIELRDLHALAGHDPSVTILERLRQALSANSTIDLSVEGKQRAARLASVLETALQARARSSLRDLVERTWNSLAGPATLHEAQDLEDAQAFLRRLDEISEVADLEDVTRLEEQLAGLCARPRALASARVEIMTIHKAKGLEFETVILPALERRVRESDQPLLRWTRVADVQQGLILAPLSEAGAQGDPVYRWAQLLEQQRTQQERARLLYVAATRARRELHLLGNVKLKQKNGATELCPPRQGSMLAMLWPEVAAQFQQQWSRQSGGTGAGAITRHSVQLRRLPLAWSVPAPGSALTTSAIRVEIVGPEPEFDWVSETGRHIGTLVHRELDRMSRQAVPDQDSVARNRPRLYAELAELGVPVDRIDSACDRVIAAIRYTLEDARGRWIFGLEGRIVECESELPLSGVSNGEIVHRIVDRTFVDEHGIRWIVDFKTSAHEGGGLESFLDQEVERYRHQLSLYAHLMRAYKPDAEVRAALYFPLLQAWRVVEG